MRSIFSRFHKYLRAVPYSWSYLLVITVLGLGIYFAVFYQNPGDYILQFTTLFFVILVTAIPVFSISSTISGVEEEVSDHIKRYRETLTPRQEKKRDQIDYLLENTQSIIRTEYYLALNSFILSVVLSIIGTFLVILASACDITVESIKILDLFIILLSTHLLVYVIRASTVIWNILDLPNAVDYEIKRIHEEEEDVEEAIEGIEEIFKQIE